MIQVANLSKSFGSRQLFENVTFSLTPGERVGLVGRNGSGKSTMMKILMGREEADGGQVITPQNYLLGYLDQHIRFTEPTLLLECVKELPKEQEHDHYRAERILSGLGFTDEDFQRPPHEFSGGYQLRIQLTKCLLREPDLLLLDEPTNYLDILSLQWMRKFLTAFPGEVIIITHDREFMDSVTTHTMGLSRKRLLKVKGSTEKFYNQLALDEEIYEKTRVNQQKKLEHMQRFVERFRAKASKATQAQSVAKKIEKLKILQEMDSEQMLGFRFNYSPTPAKSFLEVDNLSFGFDAKSPLFSHLSFSVKADDRVAIIGKNGKGKTTLLNVLAGKLKPLEGSFTFHPTAEVGYYQQTHRKDLNPNFDIIQEINSANIQLETSQVRSICGAMMFPGDDAKKKISVLSGGEQSRVLLGKVLAHSSNFLMLDEPTNHLDMESIEVISEEINAFPGPVMLVTHNENMIKEMATKLVVFTEKGCEYFEGTYDYFLEKVGWDESTKSKNKNEKMDKKQQKRMRAELVQQRSKELNPIKKQADQLELEIENIDKELETANTSLSDLLSQEGVGSELQELYKTIGQMQIRQEQCYSELDQLMQKIDEIQNRFDEALSSMGLNS